MSQRNNPVIPQGQYRPFRMTAPSQDVIDAYVREAHRMRAEAVADLLARAWRRLTGRKHAVGAPSYPAKA